MLTKDLIIALSPRGVDFVAVTPFLTLLFYDF